MSDRAYDQCFKKGDLDKCFAMQRTTYNGRSIIFSSVRTYLNSENKTEMG